MEEGIYSKSKKTLRITEWIVLGRRKNELDGWFNEVIDKSLYQKVADPVKLIKYSMSVTSKELSFWYFFFFGIMVILLAVFAIFNKYLSNLGIEIDTYLRIYITESIFAFSIIFTYFLLAFRMPSATRQILVSKNSIEEVSKALRTEIISEKEADLLEKNISDLAETFKRRKVLIRIVTIASITFLVKEADGWFVGIATGLTIFVSIMFEMYAFGSRAIFANAKYAVREIALEHNTKKIMEESIINIPKETDESFVI